MAVSHHQEGGLSKYILTDWIFFWKHLKQDGLHWDWRLLDRLLVYFQSRAARLWREKKNLYSLCGISRCFLLGLPFFEFSEGLGKGGAYGQSAESEEGQLCQKRLICLINVGKIYGEVRRRKIVRRNQSGVFLEFQVRSASSRCAEIDSLEMRMGYGSESG